MSKSAEDDLHQIYFYNPEKGQPVPGNESWQTSDAYHARLNELDVILHHYNDAATGEIRILMWDPATNWWDSWGDERWAQAINNLGEFCGGRRAEVKSKGNKTTTISVPYVFDGGDFYEFSDYDRGARDLNDTGDVLLGSNHIYLSEHEQFFDVWTMLDPENSDEDLNEFSRYSSVSTYRLNDEQLILGRAQYYDSSRSVYVRRSFYLVPASL